MGIEIIAEIGQNHNGDINKALEMIEVVKKCGADIAKFQLYNAVELFQKKNNPWYEYNCKTELSKGDLIKLVEKCNEVNIEFMASVFDIERISWLEDVDVKKHKIASRSINKTDLVEKVLQTGKETLISLGMWNEENFPIFSKMDQVRYLFCISKYPTHLSDINFNKIDFNSKYAGFSDHTIGLSASIAAMSRGANIIEKHFTLDTKDYGPDHQCSMTPSELKQLCDYRNDLIKMF